MNNVLKGVRILDFGRYIAGPMCAALLGDFGADVIRVERVGGGEDRYQYPVTDNGEGPCFLQMNRNKRGITLDPMSEGGRAILKRLIATADVVVANLPADTLVTMGLDYAYLKTINPKIVLSGISAFGEHGPYGNRVGFDGVAQVMSGAAYLSGFDGRPTKSYASFVDVSTGVYAALSTLAAIMEQKSTGRGQEVQTMLFATALSIVNFLLIEQDMVKKDRIASGNRAQSSGPADVFQTNDGKWIIAQSLGDNLFKRWARMIGEPNWVDDPRFATDELRADNGEILSARMQEWTRQYTMEEALEHLAKARLPAGPVLSPQQVLDDPHVQQTGIFTRVDYPGLPKPYGLVTTPSTFSQSPVEVTRRPPTVGEHTDEVLLSIGYGQAEIEEFRKNKVI